MTEIKNEQDWNWEACTNGMIFEFKEMEPAKAFAIAVKERFNLDCRVFDNSEDAERVHLNPFGQKAPVVHVDRPYWTLPEGASRQLWDAAWAKEKEIWELAEETFGGNFIGT